MKRLNLFVFVFALTSVIISVGCGGGSPSDPNRGFDVGTYAYNPNPNPNYPSPIIPANGNLVGSFVSGSGTYGTVTSFGVATPGFYTVTGAKVPGKWHLRFGPGYFDGSPCLTSVETDRNVSLGSYEKIECPGFFIGFVASPSSFNAAQPNATATFSGSGIDTTYGMPKLAFYDYTGNIRASTTATQLIWNNGEIVGFQANTNDLTQAYDGTHTVVIHNIKADGSWGIIGGAFSGYLRKSAATARRRWTG